MPNPLAAPIALGAGERMIDRALIDLFRLRGKFPGDQARPSSAAP